MLTAKTLVTHRKQHITQQHIAKCQYLVLYILYRVQEKKKAKMFFSHICYKTRPILIQIGI